MVPLEPKQAYTDELQAAEYRTKKLARMDIHHEFPNLPIAVRAMLTVVCDKFDAMEARMKRLEAKHGYGGTVLDRDQ